MPKRQNRSSMKMALGIALTVCAVAYCQNAPSMTGHPQTATAVVLQSGGSTYSASGERTSGFPTPPAPEPLGTAARRLRAAHANDVRSETVVERSLRNLERK